MWIPCYHLGSVRPLKFPTRLPTASSDTFAAVGSVTSPITWTTLSLSARHAHRNARMRWPRWTVSAPGLGSPSRSTNETAQPPVSRFSALWSTRKPPSSASPRTSWGASDPFSRTGVIGKCAGGESSNPWWGTQPRLQSGTLRSGLPAPHVGPPQRESPPPTPPSDQAEQVVPLRPDLVEAVCRRMERSLLPAPLL